ncbi:MAG: hypothetical protein DCC57_19670 [Chloroflexi bacterium]|nr:MAG: hypothetical protein DCC57_19670 [Chloroflexota bacterium]
MEWHTDGQESKISHEFAERLAAMPCEQQVRAIVMPAPYMVSQGEGRPRGAERQAIIREARQRTEQTFAEIDKVLAETGGRRVTDAGNALGFIVVETTADGIEAICDLDWVGSVLEDQPIYPVHEPKPADRPDRGSNPS